MIQLIVIVLVATIAILVVIAVIAAFVSFLIGKGLNIVVRVILGWTLHEKSNPIYISFATIFVLVIIPITIWVRVFTFGLVMNDWFLMILTILCSIIGVAGYYAAHFGVSPDQFAAFHAAGIMRVHEQEAKWFNTNRTNWYVFWHWTVARRALELDHWFKENVTRRITGKVSTGE